jgi:D-serine deaminase-like pyridoxal phosphate-dependent protein
MNSDAIATATLLLDEKRARANIARMAVKARENKLIYRPHLKTPQSAAVASWYKDEGITKATVSSLKMAEYYASAGWTDITIAVPANIRLVPEYNALASRITLQLTVDSVEAVKALGKGLCYQTGVYIKIDAGYHRTGVAVTDLPVIETIIDHIQDCPHLQFQGFLTHAGHSYNCRGKVEIQALHRAQLDSLKPLRNFGGIISIGDTPTCSVAAHFDGVDEVRPGNLIYYDLKMVQIGACEFQDIAVCLAAPVISIKRGSHAIIHAGAVHFSKDFMLDDDGGKSFGQVVRLTSDGWTGPVPGVHVRSLCQEHGFVFGPDNWLKNVQAGEIIGVLPVHSCLTADCMGSVTTLEGRTLSMMPR